MADLPVVGHDGAMNVGDVLAGKYTVERVLGGGETGVVVAARHHELDDLRAIKVLRRELLADEALVARFLAGARSVARLESEHIVRVFDTGRLEDGTPYLVMEHLVGEDLAGVLQRSGPLPIQEAVLCILQVCDAVAEARARGIAHRSLRPTNLFLVRRPSGLPCIKILGFGLAKRADRRDPAYLAPEQIRASQDEDGRTEVWTLAVILYELLTGRRPFVADEAFEMVAKILEQRPAPPSTVRRDLPPDLDAILALCLEKDPEQRMQSVEALHYALAPFGPLPAVADALPARRGVARDRTQTAPAPVPATASPGSIAAAPAAVAPPFEPPAATAPPSIPPAAPPSIPPAAVSSVPPAAVPSVPPAAVSSVPPAAVPSVPPAAVPSVPPAAVPSVPPAAGPSVPPPDVAPVSEREPPGGMFASDSAGDASESDLPLQGRGLGTSVIAGVLVVAAVAIGIFAWSRQGDSGPSSPSASALPAVSASVRVQEQGSPGKPSFPPPAVEGARYVGDGLTGADAGEPRAAADAGSDAFTTVRDAGAAARLVDAGAVRPRKGPMPRPAEKDESAPAPAPPAEPEKAAEDPY